MSEVKFKSIVFHLDNNLKIYIAEIVNSGLELVYEHRKNGNNLELFTNFSQIWTKLYSEYIQSSSKIILIVGENAGFTDTRVIFLWLKSHLLFTNTKFKMLKTNECMDISDLSEKIIELIEDSKLQTEAVYSKEARIGYNIT